MGEAPGPEQRLAGGRYEVTGRLGEGGMGIVYEARDHHDQTTVAIKAMRKLSPEGILRFKNEFRALRGIDHPNLVHLGELFEDAGRLYFTMERVDGIDFQTALQGAADDGTATETIGVSSVTVDDEALPPATARSLPAPAELVDRDRLVDMLVQLVHGLRALHAAERVHRDVKPSNVLVTPGGRVVLLDFGLVSTEPGTEGELMGTAAYMAPEQAAGEAVGPAADWYALGVMLYQALTGRLPFEGSAMQMLARKVRSDPVTPSTWVDVDRELESLCMALLLRDPAHRADGETVLETLVPSGVNRAGWGAFVRPAFVGREDVLASLAEALDDVRTSRTVVGVLEGPSGVGKSRTVQAFCATLNKEHRDALVFRGRCYVREAVRYRGVDEIVDALSRLVARRQIAASTEAGGAAMATLFPVMHGPWPTRADVELPRDPGSLRSLAVTELRALLRRLAETSPVVLVLDDLQWIGADGEALLEDLIGPPEPPSLLLVVTRRPPVRQDAGAVSVSSLPGDVRLLPIGPLRPAEAERLAQLLLDLEDGHPLAAQLADASRGSPLALELLARQHLGTGDATLSDADAALWQRIQELDFVARRLALLVALAERPVRLDVLGAAGRMKRKELLERIHALRTLGLLRLDVRRGSTVVGASHDRVREVIERELDDEEARGLHEDLAEAMTALQGPDDALAYHWHAAGFHERAGAHARSAAAIAERELAFERAAARLADYVSWAQPDEVERRRAEKRMGNMLAHAGRGAEAAKAYRAAARGASDAETLALKHAAAVQLIQSGRFDEGVELARGLLASVGFEPHKPLASLASFVRDGAALHLSGYAFRARHDVSVEETRRMDLLTTLSTGYGATDIVGGASLQTKLVKLALSLGDPARAGIALAPLAAYWAGLGPRGQAHAAAILERARAIAGRVDDPWLRGRLAFGTGFTALHRGHWSEACEQLAEAERVLSSRGVGMGVAGDIAASRVALLWGLGFAGRLAELRRLAPSFVRDAIRRNDIFAATNLRVGMPACAALVDDDVDAAARGMERALEAWRPKSQAFDTVRIFADYSRMQLELYAGKTPTLDKTIVPRGALLMGNQLIRGYMTDARARCALASGDERRAMRLTRRLERERVPWCSALALLLRRDYRRAAEALEAVGMTAHAAAARYREGDREGALEVFRAERVRNPEAWVRMLAP